MDELVFGWLAAAVFFDIRERRIPNWLVATGVAVAIGVHLYEAGAGGLLFAARGLAVGILLLLVPFALGGVGAGDVKLLGMVGAFKGVLFVFNSFLWMALIGGVMALFCLVREGRLGESLARWGRGAVLALSAGRGRVFLGSLQREPFQVSFPYGLAIALGAAATCFRGWW